MSDETAHGYGIEHGLSTPHKYPDKTSSIVSSFSDLSSQQYPTGRVWYMSENSNFKAFHEAINTSFARLIEDSNLSLDKMLPDNDNFDENDAELWEYRLGLITNINTDLELRKASIKRKLGHPNNVKARQSASYIEYQLQLAGFNVYLHENTLPYRTPSDIVEISSNLIVHNDTLLHGNSIIHGGESFDVIANSIEPNEQYSYGDDSNLWSTFFIGGPNLGDIATVPIDRQREFKELVIKLKPAHLTAFTFINYAG